jgi:flagellar hook-length control protein FliK
MLLGLLPTAPDGEGLSLIGVPATSLPVPAGTAATEPADGEVPETKTPESDGEEEDTAQGGPTVAIDASGLSALLTVPVVLAQAATAAGEGAAESLEGEGAPAVDPPAGKTSAQPLRNPPGAGVRAEASPPAETPPALPEEGSGNRAVVVEEKTAEIPAPDTREGSAPKDAAPSVEKQQVPLAAEGPHRETVKAADLADGAWTRRPAGEALPEQKQATPARAQETPATVAGKEAVEQTEHSGGTSVPRTGESARPVSGAEGRPVATPRVPAEASRQMMPGMTVDVDPHGPPQQGTTTLAQSSVDRPAPVPQVIAAVVESRHTGSADRKEEALERHEGTSRGTSAEGIARAPVQERAAEPPVSTRAHEQQAKDEPAQPAPSSREEDTQAVVNMDHSRTAEGAANSLHRPSAPAGQRTDGSEVSPKTALQVPHTQSAPERADGGARVRESGVGAYLASRADGLPPDLSRRVMDQVVRQLSLQVEGTSSEMRLRLDPPTLGEVTLTVRMEDGRMQAQIDVAHASVKTALEAQMPQLRQSLAGTGIEVQRIEVFTAGQAMSQEAGNGRGDRSHRREPGKHQATAEAVEQYQSARRMGYNTMEVVM